MLLYFYGQAVLGLVILLAGIKGLRNAGRPMRGRRLLEGIEFLWTIIAVILISALFGMNPVAVASMALLIHFLISAALSTMVETRTRQGLDAGYPGWFSWLEIICGALMLGANALFVIPAWGQT
ncbi:hypothetical protein E4656_16380 [Natronospirillum operosum]|uniref:Uncharacterized protein n=1 Tax=Natronospirillum operosum TaxID=2759953 RepID=A0A4Z0W8C5_9GAMM|nr:hypothetical protein [Natronospirillum operosum]TGG91298.1 hypothetical protein E4656_16380 [Natronospirillum operosum]